MNKQGKSIQGANSALASVRLVKLGSKCGTKLLCLSQAKTGRPLTAGAKIPACLAPKGLHFLVSLLESRCQEDQEKETNKAH